MIATILSLIGTIVPIILQNQGIIGASSANLISGLTSQGVALLGSLQSGSTKTQDTLAALAALSGVIAVLKANTSLPEATLTEIQDVESDVQAALAGYAVAEGGYNAALYAQIAPVA